MKQSAGILLYKKVNDEFFFLLGHPGGPYWKNKNQGTWSIPKGEILAKENPLDAAKREFEEETGIGINGVFTKLNPVKMKSGKIIFAWALEKDIDISNSKSNKIEIEWPPKTGRRLQVLEIDTIKWFTVDEALKKIIPPQRDFILQLLKNKSYG